MPASSPLRSGTGPGLEGPAPKRRSKARAGAPIDAIQSSFDTRRTTSSGSLQQVTTRRFGVIRSRGSNGPGTTESAGEASDDSICVSVSTRHPVSEPAAKRHGDSRGEQQPHARTAWPGVPAATTSLLRAARAASRPLGPTTVRSAAGPRPDGGPSASASRPPDSGPRRHRRSSGTRTPPLRPRPGRWCHCSSIRAPTQVKKRSIGRLQRRPSPWWRYQASTAGADPRRPGIESSATCTLVGPGGPVPGPRASSPASARPPPEAQGRSSPTARSAGGQLRVAISTTPADEGRPLVKIMTTNRSPTPSPPRAPVGALRARAHHSSKENHSSNDSIISPHPDIRGACFR